MFSHWCLSGTIFLLLRHNLSLNYSPSTYFTVQTFIILSLPNHLFAIDRHTNLFFSQASSAWDSSFAVKKRRACSRRSQLQLWDNSAILRPKKILHLIAYACNRGETWLRNIRCWVRPQIVCMHAVRQRLCRIPTFSRAFFLWKEQKAGARLFFLNGKQRLLPALFASYLASTLLRRCHSHAMVTTTRLDLSRSQTSSISGCILQWTIKERQHTLQPVQRIKHKTNSSITRLKRKSSCIFWKISNPCVEEHIETSKNIMHHL